MLNQLAPASIALLLLASVADGQLRPFDLDAAGRMVQLAEPRIAPNGRQVALVTRRANYDKNTFDTELLLIDIATGGRRNLTPGRSTVRSPRWSPTGDRLAFIAPNDSATSQIWILPILAGGEATMLTRAKGGVRQFAWRPDGGAIAYVTEDERPAHEGPERFNRSFEVERNDYLATAAPVSRHIWTISPDSGEARRITSGSWSLTSLFDDPISWARDGRSIYIGRQIGPGTGHFYGRTVSAVDVASGDSRDIGPFGFGVVSSPDGRTVAYSGPRGPTPEFSAHGIYVLPAEGGAPELASDIDVSLWNPVWYDATTLLLCGEQGTRTALWLKPLRGRSSEVRLGGLHPSCGGLDVAPKGAIAMIATTETQPAELYWLERPGGEPKRLTTLNGWISDYAVARAERVTWRTDEFVADGVLTFPPNTSRDTKLPLALVIHGGPMAQSTTVFQPVPQLIAARGFLVFQPNYRGSSGLGNAYQSAVVGDAGAGPGRDVMAGVATLINRGFVDTTRMGVSGWSYGGFMTTWLMGHYPVWRAGMAGAAVTDYADSYYLSDYGPSFGAAWGGSPFKPPYDRIVREQSPITYAGQIKAPMLILATTGDARVPVVQSYKLYSALRDFGVPVTFIAYPVPGHFPGDPVHIRDVRRRWVEWFVEQLDAASR